MIYNHTCLFWHHFWHIPEHTSTQESHLLSWPSLNFLIKCHVLCSLSLCTELGTFPSLNHLLPLASAASSWTSFYLHAISSQSLLLINDKLVDLYIVEGPGSLPSNPSYSPTPSSPVYQLWIWMSLECDAVTSAYVTVFSSLNRWNGLLRSSLSTTLVTSSLHCEQDYPSKIQIRCLYSSVPA